MSGHNAYDRERAEEIKKAAPMAGSIVTSNMPWQTSPLKDWAICGMNHYHIEGERFLFVSMVRDGQCITREGKDDELLWRRLAEQALGFR